jgi:hypothetical protein
MGGIVPGLVGFASKKMNTIDEVKLFVYYSVKDLAGESSAHFMAENVAKPFVNYKDNQPVSIKHFRIPNTFISLLESGKDKLIISMFPICIF